MWVRILLTTLFCYTLVMLVESRPTDQVEGPLWPPLQLINYHLRNAVRQQQRIDQDDSRSIEDDNGDNMLMDYDLDKDLNILPSSSSSINRLSADKRALTMLARWGPFNDFGKNRTPIRSSPRLLDPVVFKQEPRQRVQGQPLRWG